MGQFVELSDLKKQMAELKSQNKKIVFTNGCFDLLHIGHVRYLQEARKLGDALVVGINSDASVKILKGPTRPVQNQNDRAEILAALGAVSFTTIFTEETPYNLINEIRPHILVKGGDWKINQIVGSDIVTQDGGQVMSLQFVDGKSTTQIISKAQNK